MLLSVNLCRGCCVFWVKAGCGGWLPFGCCLICGFGAFGFMVCILFSLLIDCGLFRLLFAAGFGFIVFWFWGGILVVYIGVCLVDLVCGWVGVGLVVCGLHVCWFQL